MDTLTDTVIKQIKNGSTEILSLCQNVPEACLAAPFMSNGWSVKDTVAHISAWVWRCAGLLEHAHSTNGPLSASPDVDGLNREFYLERQYWSWHEVETDFLQAHWALFNAIRQLPPTRLRSSLAQQVIAKNTCEHYAQHLPDLKHWRNRVTAEKSPVLKRIRQPHSTQVGAL